MWIRKAQIKGRTKTWIECERCTGMWTSSSTNTRNEKKEKTQQQQYWCGVIVCGVKSSYLKILLAFIAFYVRFSQCAPFVEPEREKHTKIANDFPFAFTRRTPFFFLSHRCCCFYCWWPEYEAAVWNWVRRKAKKVHLKEYEYKIYRLHWEKAIKMEKKTLLRAHHVYCENEFELAIVAHSSGTCIKVEFLFRWQCNFIHYIGFYSPKKPAVIVNVCLFTRPFNMIVNFSMFSWMAFFLSLSPPVPSRRL